MPQLLNGLALSNTQFLWKSFTGPVVKETKASLPTPAFQSQKIKVKKKKIKSQKSKLRKAKAIWNVMCSCFE